jgi:hypothetical protein
MNEAQSKTYKIWHDFIETPNAENLAAILYDDVKFHSPFVWKPKKGKIMTTAILMTVTEIFVDFRYVREIVDGDNWALEFAAKVGEFSLRGVDLIELNADGKIIDFEVMIRPVNALQTLGAEMGRKLAEKGLIENRSR